VCFSQRLCGCWTSGRRMRCSPARSSSHCWTWLLTPPNHPLLLLVRVSRLSVHVVRAWTKWLYLHSLLIFCRKKWAFHLCIARRSGTASREWHLLSINPLTGNCLARRNIYSTSCLNLDQHMFAYCAIVYNHNLMGHEKQKQKRRFPLLSSTISTHSNYLRRINRKDIT